MTRRHVLIPRQRTAMLVGIALTAAGAYFLYEAYEARGAKRPWALRYASAGLL